MRADRLLSLMLLLQSKGHLSAQDLAERLEVSERTIYRDVEALSFAGVPVYTRPGTNGGVFLDENYRISLTGLAKSEIQALFISGVASPLADLGLEKTVEDVLLKLFVALPSVHRREVERARQRLYIDPAYWFQLAEPMPHFSLLQQAVWEDRQIEFDYRHQDGEWAKRSVDAYGLVAKGHIWYLIGKPKDGHIRTYRVVRMRDLALTDTIFERNPNFDLAAYWQESSRTFEQEIRDSLTPCIATLQVKQEVLWYFENLMLGKYERLPTVNETEWTTLRVWFSSLDDAKMRILGLGAEVQVAQPQELLDLIVKTARAIVVLYT